MKKILLATSALSMMAGAAAADTSVSSEAYIGVVMFSGGGSDIVYSYEVSFDGSGETDNGITFGASTSFENYGGIYRYSTGYSYSSSSYSHGGASVFVSSGNVTLTIGDTDTAIANIGNNDTGIGYSSGTVVRLDFAVGDASISVSTGANCCNENQIAGSYAIGDVTVKAGFGEDSGSFIGASFAAGDATITAGMGFPSGGGSNTWAIDVEYVMGALTLGAYTDSSESSSLSADYSLGGGATVEAGISFGGGYSTTTLGLSLEM